MNMNNSCNNCNQNPCQCHTTCVTPVACIPPELAHRAKAKGISVEGLLGLIDKKCGDEVCQVLQIEISLLFMLLGLEAYRPDPLTTVEYITNNTTTTNELAISIIEAVHGTVNPEGTVNSTLDRKAIQLVTNMVKTLEGDLTDKYPSAELMKKEILSVWDCMYNKQQHHGEWDANYVMREVQPSDNELCILDGDSANLISTVKIIIPVDVGSTVFHLVDGKRCLFESLVDNNTEEPTKLSVLEGKWLNYCDLREVIDCVLPREKITPANCVDACDDLNGDGIIERKTMCERMEAIEAYMLAHP